MEKEGLTSLSLFWYNRGKKTRLEEMIFDTHTHLNIEEFAGREDEELALAAEMGVTRMNIVGFDKPTIERALEQLLAGIRLKQGHTQTRSKLTCLKS